MADLLLIGELFILFITVSQISSQAATMFLCFSVFLSLFLFLIHFLCCLPPVSPYGLWLSNTIDALSFSPSIFVSRDYFIMLQQSTQIKDNCLAWLLPWYENRIWIIHSGLKVSWRLLLADRSKKAHSWKKRAGLVYCKIWLEGELPFWKANLLWSHLENKPQSVWGVFEHDGGSQLLSSKLKLASSQNNIVRLNKTVSDPWLHANSLHLSPV